MKRPMAYITAAWGNDEFENTETATKYCRKIYEAGFTPMCPETLGKETIDMFNTSDTRGSQRSYGLNYQKLGKELMSMDELAVMDGGKCILNQEVFARYSPKSMTLQ